MKKFWNLVILVLAAALVYQLYQGGKLNNIRASMISLMMPTNQHLGPGTAKSPVAPAGTPVFAAESEQQQAATPEPEASATPFFAAAPEASATPATAASTPVEAAVQPSATPEPKNQEVDLASIDRRFWPKMVKLNKDMQFSIVGPGGKLSGQVAAPAGVMVKLLEVRGTRLVVEMATGSAPQPVEMADTDIQERLREILKVVGGVGTASSRAPAAGSAATPAPFQPKLNDRGNTPFQR